MTHWIKALSCALLVAANPVFAEYKFRVMLPGLKAGVSTPTDASCTTPWGTSLTSGASTLAFKDAAVTPGNSCVSETRVCSNGNLSGTFGNQNCVAESPSAKACTTAWGATVAHGASVTAYQTSEVAYGGQCTSETQTCNNGTLSGSYASGNCTVATAAECSLPWGGTLPHGQSTTAYQAASATNAQCMPETRTCNNGTLSGSYSNMSCTYANSCKALQESGVTNSGVYYIKPTAAAIPVYCDMVNNGGGWTLVMGAGNPTRLLDMVPMNGYSGSFISTTTSVGLSDNIACSNATPVGGISQLAVAIPHTQIWASSIIWQGQGVGDACAGTNSGFSGAPWDGPVMAGMNMSYSTTSKTVSMSGIVANSINNMTFGCICGASSPQRGYISSGAFYIR